MVRILQSCLSGKGWAVTDKTLLLTFSMTLAFYSILNKMLHMTYLDVGFALVVGELKRNCRVAGFECACLEYNIFCRTYVH